MNQMMIMISSPSDAPRHRGSHQRRRRHPPPRLTNTSSPRQRRPCQSRWRPYTDPVYNGGNGVWISGFLWFRYRTHQDARLPAAMCLDGSARKDATDAFKKKRRGREGCLPQGKLTQVGISRPSRSTSIRRRP